MIKTIKTKFIVALCILAITGSAFARNNDITLIFPVSSNTIVQFDPGTKYKMLQSMQELSYILSNGGSLEYVPVNESGNKWTEIITFTPLQGRDVSGKYFVDYMIAGIKKEAKNVEVLYTGEINAKGYKGKECVISYTQGSRKEIVYIKAIAGRHDGVAYQYTTVVKNDAKTEYKKVLEKGRSIANVINTGR